MKPRTKIQKVAFEAFKQLPGLTKSQVSFGRNNVIENPLFVSKKNAICGVCNHEQDKTDFKDKGNYRCPNCKSKVIALVGMKRKFNSTNGFLCVYDIVKVGNYDFQVARYFSFNRYFVKGKGYRENIYEFNNWWFDRNSKKEVIISMLYMNYLYGEMEVREPSGTGYYVRDYKFGAHAYYTRKGIRSYQDRKIIFDYDKNKREPTQLMIEMEKSNILETVMKSGYGEVLIVDRHSNLENLFPAIKICIRNQYKIEDYGLWIDMINAMMELGADIRNRKFVCPEDLHQMHDYFIKCLKRHKQGKKLAYNQEKWERDNPDYQEYIEPFREFRIEDGDIYIRPILSTKEFYYEGEELEHCLFASNYHKNKNSLILTARVLGKRTETIEIDTQKFEIVQCRGLNNKPSEYHEQIYELMESNLELLKEFYEEPIKPKSRKRQSHAVA